MGRKPKLPKITKKKFEWKTRYQIPENVDAQEIPKGWVSAKIEDDLCFIKAANAYIEMSTKDKTAVFTSVKGLYEEFIEWNKRNNGYFTISYFAGYIKEVASLVESEVNLRSKLYTYQRLTELDWKPKPGIAFTRYREILTRDIENKDKIDLLQKLENPVPKIKASEFRILIRSKRKRNSQFSPLRETIIFEDDEKFIAQIKGRIEKCAPIPVGAKFRIIVDRKSVKKNSSTPLQEERPS